MSGYDVKCAGPRGLVESGISRSVKGADTTVLLDVSYRGSDWIFVRDEGVVFLADSTRIGLQVGEAARRVISGISGPSVIEVVGASLTPTDLRKLTAATVLKMRLSGKDGTCDLPIPRLSVDLLRKFGAEYVGLR